MRKDLRFSGSGGQGVISLALLLADAYGVRNGYEVAQTQSYGPAARGGACKAELVISDERIDYVKADGLDCFVAFNKSSFSKFKHDVSRRTQVFIDSTFIPPEEAAELDCAALHAFPATGWAEKNFRPVCANIVMMGYFVAKTGHISLEDAQAAIEHNMAPKLVGMNLQALRFGYDKGLED